jgi:hypothetical protein
LALRDGVLLFVQAAAAASSAADEQHGICNKKNRQGKNEERVTHFTHPTTSIPFRWNHGLSTYEIISFYRCCCISISVGVLL